MKFPSGLVRPYATSPEDDDLLEDDELDFEDEEDEEDEEEDEAASLGDLKSEIPDSTATFRESCLERGLSLDEAKDGWMNHLRAKIRRRDQTLARRPAPQPQIQEDPIAVVNTLVAEKVPAGMPRHKATLSVFKDNPDLRAAYVAATNAKE